MKTLNKIIIFAMLLSFAGCSDSLLEETARNKFEPSFFTTEKGIEGGLTALYSSLRRVYGQPYYYNACETGTDEYTYGSQADQNFKAADLCGLGVPDAANSRFDVIWNVAYGAINNASAIIANGTKANMSPALLAEARFFRGFYYFQMVQTFGGVPLDLGGGELEFNTTPTRVSTRNTVPEVYKRAIFPDLLKAIEDLPENPRLTGTVTKNVARLILAKAYLTYGWWLENPRDIPTYPLCDRVDIEPDKKASHQDYFQLAYNTAKTAIENPGPYKLQPTFYDVNVGSNDRNSEIMLWADHNENNAKYSESNVTGWDGGDAQNQAVWMVTWYFQSVNSSSSATTWTNSGSFFRTVQAGQSFSRMWSRMAVPFKPLIQTFADKTNDSRFDGTFVQVYRATYHLNPAPTTPSILYNANFLPVKPNEPMVTFLTNDPGGINYSNSTYKSGMGLGFLPGRADFVMPITAVSRTVFPGLWKLGPYRKDKTYNDDKIASSRPYNILKFSELYLIAAEAAVKLNKNAEARDFVNVLRQRAGKWSFSVADNAAVTVDNDRSAAMIAATPATIDINYILDERSREFFGEGYRWHDLARTQKWEEYAGTYQICKSAGDAAPETVTRQLDKYLYLRPVPTGQIDNMEGDAEYKKNYQNPGYN